MRKGAYKLGDMKYVFIRRVIAHQTFLKPWNHL
jgi:hypothetical protein